MPERPKRTSKPVSKTIGRAQPKSRAQADAAVARSDEVQPASEGWPLTPDGRPMAKLEMSASELLPTGQFANVSVGPGRLTLFIDPQEEGGIRQEEQDTIAKAMNQMSDLIQIDVIAVQRNLVLEGIQSDNTSDDDK
jgi:hypothetical protein